MILSTTNYEQKLPYAHYSDSRWDKPQLVFAAPDFRRDEDLQWEYDDRLQMWQYEKWLAGARSANEMDLPSHSAAWYQQVLRVYYDDQGLELRWIFKGVYRGNGYQYCVFGFVKEVG
jgi:hypothetical protein